jgi:multidrug resistance efflux pump
MRPLGQRPLPAWGPLPMSAASILRVLLWPFRRALALLKGCLLSLRFWVLFFLVVIVLLVGYYVLSDRYAPFTTDAYVQAYVIQVAPRVGGQVVAVCVEENQKVIRGQKLFEIDPRPFRHKVTQLEARLAQMTQQVAQMESELKGAKADDARLVAEETFARAVFDQETEIFKQQSTTERRYLDAVQKYKAAKAARERGRASVSKAEQALAAVLGSEHALVAAARAELADARLALEWSTVAAPADGYVTDLQLRVGAYVHAGKPALTCIDTGQFWVVANYRENALEHIAAGQRVGLTFNTYPGRVFEGRVQSVGWGVSEGQGVPSGDLPAVKNPQAWIRQAQRFQVRINPETPADHPLRVGATATVTVYTTDDHWLHPVAEAWQQVVAWFDYLY